MTKLQDRDGTSRFWAPLGLAALILRFAAPALGQDQRLDTSTIEKITGLAGTFSEEEKVFKVTSPRTDVQVTVDEWQMPPFMGLTSWAAFQAGNKAEAMVMGLPSGGPDYEQMLPVKRDWEANRSGVLLTESIRWVFAEVQKSHSPQPQDITDPRVRQALLLAVDREEMARAVLAELGIVAHSWVHPEFPQYRAVQDVLIRHPHDPRRASAMLAELGWRPGPDGILEKGPGQRFTLSIRERENEKEALIAADNWKAIGISPVHEPFPTNLLRDREARATFTGVDISSNPMGGLSAVRRFIGDATPTRDNRWTGTNRGGYANPAWDAIGERMRVTLEDSKRVELERDLVRIYSSELPTLPLYYEVQPVPVGGGLTGVQPIRGIAHTGHVMHTWNAHEWDVQPRS